MPPGSGFAVILTQYSTTIQWSGHGYVSRLLARRLTCLTGRSPGGGCVAVAGRAQCVAPAVLIFHECFHISPRPAHQYRFCVALPAHLLVALAVEHWRARAAFAPPSDAPPSCCMPCALCFAAVLSCCQHLAGEQCVPVGAIVNLGSVAAATCCGSLPQATTAGAGPCFSFPFLARVCTAACATRRPDARFFLLSAPRRSYRARTPLDAARQSGSVVCLPPPRPTCARATSVPLLGGAGPQFPAAGERFKH